MLFGDKRILYAGNAEIPSKILNSTSIEVEFF